MNRARGSGPQQREAASRADYAPRTRIDAGAARRSRATRGGAVKTSPPPQRAGRIRDVRSGESAARKTAAG